MSTFVDWLKNPLNTETGSPSGLTIFLFVGLILVALAIWAIIFKHIRATLE